MSDDLVKRLKKWADGEAMAAYGDNLVDHPDEHEGSQISELIDTLTDRIEELEAKLREMALDCLAADGQAAEAYQAQLAAEAKLAKAVGALEVVLNACYEGRMIPRPGHGAGGMTIEANIKGSIYTGVPAWPIEEACTTLAELKGEDRG